MTLITGCRNSKANPRTAGAICSITIRATNTRSVFLETPEETNKMTFRGFQQISAITRGKQTTADCVCAARISRFLLFIFISRHGRFLTLVSSVQVSIAALLGETPTPPPPPPPPATQPKPATTPHFWPALLQHVFLSRVCFL